MNSQISFSNIVILTLVAAFGHFMVDFMLSIWPVYKTIMQIDLAEAGMIAVGAVLVAEAMQVLFGRLIDRGFAKPLIIFGFLMAAISAFFPYGETTLFFLIVYLCTCIGSAAFHPTAASILTAMPHQKKNLLVCAFQAGGMLGTACGQLSFSWTLFSLQRHTEILVIPSLCLAVFVLFYVKKHMIPQKSDADGAPFAIIKQFFQFKPLRFLYIIQVCNQIILWSFIFLLPDFLSQRGHSTWISFGGGHLFFMLGAAVTAIPAALLADKLTVPKTIFWVSIVSLIFLYTAVGIYEIPSPLLLANLFILGALLGVVPPLAIAYGSDLAPKNRGLVTAFLMGLVWIVSETIGLGGSSFIANLFEEDGPAISLACINLFGFIGACFAYKLSRLPTSDMRFEPIPIDREKSL
jgi:FSR family fosmidomycin resistance protein-like MFS transporter